MEKSVRREARASWYRSWLGFLSSGMIMVMLNVVLFVPAAQAHPRTTCTTDCVTVYDTPAIGGEAPFGITRGPLKSQWFTYGDAIARIDGSGHLTRYPLPTAGAITRWVTTDKRRRVWFTEFGKVGWIRVHPDGSSSLREYATPYEDAGISALVIAPNHRAYFTEQLVGKIASVNIRTGAFREYDLPSNDPLGMTMGPDGALWFTDRANAKVGRMTLQGHVREWDLPATANIQRIVSGPDGALWFTDLNGNRLWRITTRGRLSSYPIAGGPVGISVGRDRQLYLTLFSNAHGALVRVNLHGQITGRWELPGAAFALQNAPGHGFDIWVADRSGHVYRVTPYIT